MQNEISFEYEGTQYTLTFTRKTIKELNQRGFTPAMAIDTPAFGVPMLVRGAFLAKNRWTKPEKIDEIYEHITNRKEFVSKLLEMYAAPINEMLDDPEDDEKNVEWEANF